MKYFSGPWANHIVNIWIVDHLAIFHFQLPKKRCLQNFYSFKKMDDPGHHQ